MFQTRLRELREVAGYKSQQAFADAFGVAQSTVGGWESGKREPNYETTMRLAQFFGVSVDYLLGRQLWNNKIFELLVQKNLTLDDLSKRTGIPSETIWAFSTLKKTTGMKDCLDAVAFEFDVDPAYLIGKAPYSPYGAYQDMSPDDFEWARSEDDPYEAYDLHQAMAFEHDETNQYFQKQKEPIPVSEDGPSETAQVFMPLVDKLTPDQQQLLLAQLQAWTGQNERPSPAAPDSGGGKAPGSDS